ncbi:MAG: hypothetical protein FWF86_07525, partial [Clostridia bacterium]|nr:hypothetical protein [Clostridia bacterium]
MMRKNVWLALFLCFCMVAGAAVATEEQPATPASVAADLQDSAALATVNGEVITWGDIKREYQNLENEMGIYYDMTGPDNVNLFRAYVLDTRITLLLILQQAAITGLSLSPEEQAEVFALAEADWEAAIMNYLDSYYPVLNEESPREEKDQARKDAEAYYGEMGYDLPRLQKEYLQGEQIGRLKAFVTQDVMVTDADVEADYQARVAADRDMFENDLSAYVEYNRYVEQSAMYAAMSGTTSDMEHA